MRASPQPPASGSASGFAARKRKILAQLATPDAEYADASPKGSVDAEIRALVGEINALDGFVTTSSCAGRVSVFVEGSKVKVAAQGAGVAAVAAEEGEGQEGEEEGEEEGQQEEGRRRQNGQTVAGSGGKGGGGAWLFVSHDAAGFPDAQLAGDVKELLGLGKGCVGGEILPHGQEGTSETACEEETRRLIHFKFEPMILHVLTASLEHAQLMLRCGLQAGFRESGAINLAASASHEGAPVTPIVAIRSMGMALESLVGVQRGRETQCTVSPEYLRELLRIANERFAENTKRIGRFRSAVLDATRAPGQDGSASAAWEDAGARRERKKAEGLRRKAELQAQRRSEDASSPLDEGADLPTHTIDFT